LVLNTNLLCQQKEICTLGIEGTTTNPVGNNFQLKIIVIKTLLKSQILKERNPASAAPTMESA
jgi:hypothetical protein